MVAPVAQQLRRFPWRRLSFHYSPGATTRPGAKTAVLCRSLRAGGGGASRSFASKEEESYDGNNRVDVDVVDDLRARGLVDERGLTAFDTLHEMQTRSCQVFAGRNLFGTYSEEKDDFAWMTFTEYDDKVNRCRSVMKHLGVESGSKVAMISNNRWEWAVIAAAAYSLNAVAVPMYEAQLPQDWTYILNDCGATVLFCANNDIFRTCRAQVLPSTPSVQAALCFDDATGEPYAFDTAMNSVQADAEGNFIRAPAVDDLANLIYTSGTTGKPKGVELTHGNIASNAKSAARSLVENPGDFLRPDTDRTLAFLPWAHSYGQTCELWICMAHGVSMGLCRGVPHILDDLQLVRPTILYAVPTLFKKIHDGVHNVINDASPLRRRLMTAALESGRQKSAFDQGNRGPLSFVENMRHRVLDGLVLSKIRDRFGGNMRFGFVAGAACPPAVLDFMDSVGIPIYEGYGLTETSPIIAINTLDHRRIGSVGRAIGGVTVHIVDPDTGRPVLTAGQEGEICCVGPNVMRGYYKNQQATEEVISTAPDGKSRMFHTGDLGCMDEDGFVKVTGRLKEQYKLENGKYVVPTPIEEAIGMSRFIQQVVLCGANRPYNVALLVPEWPAIRSELDVPEETTREEDLVNDDRVQNLIFQEIAQACRYLKKFEIPQRWALVAPFTAANGQLTPKMSIRRHKVIQAYASTIHGMYGNDPVVADAADSPASATHDDSVSDNERRAA